MSHGQRCKLALLAGAVLPLFAIGTGASAADQASPNAQAPGQTSQLGEIVVTATRQEQVLSKVPVSVSAYTEAQMDVQGVKTIADIVRYTPGISFTANSKTIAIRGVSSGAGAGTTGIYLDDTPIQMRSIGFSANNTLPGIFDLDRVEVLRGPQGTLFGAGSEGGTVRYITPQPSLTRYSAYARAEGSATQGGGPNGELGAAVGGPILQDKLGFRVSLWGRRDGGYIDRIDTSPGGTVNKNTNSQNTAVARAALTWSPIEHLTITPSIYYQNRVQHDTDSFWKARSDLSNGVFISGDPEQLPDKDHFTLSTLKVQYDFAGMSLISNTSAFKRHELTGYEGTLYNLSYFQTLIGTPGDNACDTCRGDIYPLLLANGFNLPGFGRYSSPATVTNEQKNFTQEVRLQSDNPDARLTWVAGLFYQNNRSLSIEEIHDPQLEQISRYLFGMSATDYWGEGLLPQYGDDDYINHTIAHDKQLAGFLDVTLALTSQLKIEGGLRYAYASFNFNNFGDGAQNFGRSEGQGRESEHPFTPKINVQFQADDNNLYYATYAKGFRTGGANPPIPFQACKNDLTALGLASSPDSYASDTVNSYEIGAKNKLFDRRLQLESSVYYLKWNGIQESVGLPSCGYQFTGNLGQAESKGFDVQAQYAVGAFTGQLAVGYTDASYTETLKSGKSTVVTKGDAIGNIAPWTLAVGLQYDFDVAGRKSFARVDDTFTAKNDKLTQNTDPANKSYDAAAVIPPSLNFVSARVGVNLGHADVSLFADNLFDSRPQLSLGHNDKHTLLFTQTTYRPRTVGITATYRY